MLINQYIAVVIHIIYYLWILLKLNKIMKNLFFALFAVGMVIAFSSCGSDSCVQADWVGTYAYQGAIDTCDLGDGFSVEYEQSLVVTAGAGDSISIEGFQASINEDNCTATFLFLTLELDGDELKYFPGTDCEAVYKKN